MSVKLLENINLPDVEKQILSFWKSDNTFEKSISNRNNAKSFTFYEGPPTANGKPGIHHVISRTVKDLICRYKTMRGFKVERKAGWDTHGLPVEIEVEKTLGIKSKDDIKKFGVEAFNKACRDSVFTYLEDWKRMTERMGYWVDLENAYVTYHNEYIESVWWALKKFYESGLIYKGYKILPFCPQCETTLSSHEVSQGYQDIKDPSVYVKFKVKNGDLAGADFLVWTTTPWTLPSNVALAVNPDAEYVRVNTSENQDVILVKERLDLLKDDYTVVSTHKGKQLEYVEYEPLFSFFQVDKKAFYVTLGEFVSLEDGTGIVHMAPAFGEDDYNTGMKYSLPFIQAVGKDGLFKKEAEPYAGKSFKEADAQIIIDLKANGRLFKKEMFVHSYPHCWRHNTPLMYYAASSWFIKTTAYKEKMIGLNNNVKWEPEGIGKGRFGTWLEENIDWGFSRSRFWGTPLPIWSYTDDSGNEQYECIGSIEELKQKAINFDEVYGTRELDLHKPYIDEIVLKSNSGKEMKRVVDVIDAWFDSGSMPFAQKHYPFENKEVFENSFPADFIAEGVDQTRGWFYTLLAINSFLFNERAYKNVIVNGHVLDKHGKKMSKSVGNTVNPFEIMEKHGADVLRWYLVSSSPIGQSKLFNEDDLIEVKNKFFDTLLNIYKFYNIYSRLSGYKHNSSNVSSPSERSEIDRWIISKLNSAKLEFNRLMEDLDITRAARIVSDFTLDEVSNWYVRRNRRRFRQPADDKDKQHAYDTLYEVLTEILKMSAPFSPFITDAIYQNLSDSVKSIHLENFEDGEKTLINSDIEEQMSLAQKIVYLVRAIRVKNNLKTRQPLKQVLIPVLNEKDKTALEYTRSIILEEINVKNLVILEKDSEIIKKKAKANFKKIGPKFGKDVKAVQAVISSLTSDEIKVLEAQSSIEKDGFTILLEDIDILTENIEGWIVESEGNLTIALDTQLDDNLIEEGIIREFMNRVQNYRKQNDFDVNDNINILVKTSDNLYNVLQKNNQLLKQELLCKSIKKANGESGQFKTDINGEPVELFIEKIN